MASQPSLPPDPVIEAYKKDVDRSLLRENLKLTVEQRLRKLTSMLQFLVEWRGAASKSSRRL
jgi:hypothetical protein